MADVWGIEKVWRGIYQTNMASLPPRRVPQHYDMVLKTILLFMRNEELCEEVVARTQPRIVQSHCFWDDAANA